MRVPFTSAGSGDDSAAHQQGALGRQASQASLGHNLQVLRSGKYESYGDGLRSGKWADDVEAEASAGAPGRPDMVMWCWVQCCSRLTWTHFVVFSGGVCVLLICVAFVVGALLWPEPETPVPLDGPNGPTSPTSGLNDDAFALCGRAAPNHHHPPTHPLPARVPTPPPPPSAHILRPPQVVH